MATASFLDSTTLARLAKGLKAPKLLPSGSLSQDLGQHASETSEQISSALLQKLETLSSWKNAQPVLLGSWARGEIAVRSDLDLLFLGPEPEVQKLVQALNEEGIKIRGRVPEDSEDLTKGVATWDILNLMLGQALDEKLQQGLNVQLQKIRASKSFSKKAVQEIFQERQIRHQRFDSVQNYLEPNLKFGPGGLRDLEQARAVMDLYPGLFKDCEYERKLFYYYKEFFLLCRHFLHLNGGSDLVSGADQLELAKWFGYPDMRAFTKELQKGLARVGFYSDWVVQRARQKPAKIKKLNTVSLIAKTLLKKTDILMQREVRRQMDQLPKSALNAKVRGKTLDQFLSAKTPEFAIHALFRSRFIDKLQPRFKNLVGLVQHDQYHRYTADVHTEFAVRMVSRVKAKPILLNALKPIAQKLKPTDWNILAWAALYHDLGKGQGGEHSDIAEKWVKEDLKSFGKTTAFSKEVQWLVKNHLMLSTGAFRKNPNAISTWQEIWAQDLSEPRLRRLAILTATDIMATNPDAWNAWKSKLLLQLVQTLLSGQTESVLKLSKKLPKDFPAKIIEELDPQICQEVPTKILADDLLRSLKKDNSPLLVLDHFKNRYWVRWWQPEDRPGVLVECLGCLYSVGASVIQAGIHTSTELGAYDWFLVESSRRKEVLAKLLSTAKPIEMQQDVRFQSIEVLQDSGNELLLSLKGQDQMGMLYQACRAIFALKGNILSARVHTWGRQVEDLFSVVLPADTQDFVKKLEQELI